MRNSSFTRRKSRLNETEPALYRSAGLNADDGWGRGTQLTTLNAEGPMELLPAVIIGIVVVLLLVLLLTKLVSLAASALVGILPALIVLWFIVMILRSMVMSLFK